MCADKPVMVSLSEVDFKEDYAQLIDELTDYAAHELTIWAEECHSPGYRCLIFPVRNRVQGYHTLQEWN
jgi:hypothetical protein